MLASFSIELKEKIIIMEVMVESKWVGRWRDGVKGRREEG